jgi:ParB family transcriptional regulator, chromosome partitioning protein
LAKSNASEMLTSLDSLFTTQEQRDEAKRDSVQDIPLAQISDFPEHPFKVKQDEAMMEMAESVRQYGVLVPGLVRQLEDGSYQMVSGHRRKLASELAGRDTLPCIVRDLTDDEAVIIMVDSNLQRERVLPSEKAFAYKMKLDAMRRQAGRPKNSAPVEPNFKGVRSNEELAASSPDSRPQIQRYIRLTNLIPEILDMVDEGRIAFRPAVELSYLAEQEQRTLYDTMGCEDCTPSLAQAIKMKAFSRDGKLTDAVILSIMEEEKPNQREQFRLPRDRINRFFKPGTPAQTIEDTIIRALELYRKRQRDMER